MSTPVEKEISVATIATIDTDKSMDTLPIAQATPTDTAIVPSTVANTLTYITIPAGTEGFALEGFPVRLGKQIEDSGVKLPDGVESWWHLHCIQIGDNLEVTHIRHADAAQLILKANTNLPLRLGVAKEAPAVYGGSGGDGFHYTHTLPPPVSLDALGIDFEGFPPHVKKVNATSPLNGKLHVRQVVVELAIPGKPVINSETPGFTAYKLQQEFAKLDKTTTGIRLTVKDQLKNVKREKGSSKAFVAEDCIIL